MEQHRQACRQKEPKESAMFHLKGLSENMLRGAVIAPRKLANLLQIALLTRCCGVSGFNVSQSLLCAFIALHEIS